MKRVISMIAALCLMLTIAIPSVLAEMSGTKTSGYEKDLYIYSYVPGSTNDGAPSEDEFKPYQFMKDAVVGELQGEPLDIWGRTDRKEQNYHFMGVGQSNVFKVAVNGNAESVVLDDFYQDSSKNFTISLSADGNSWKEVVAYGAQGYGYSNQEPFNEEVSKQMTETNIVKNKAVVAAAQKDEAGKKVIYIKFDVKTDGQLRFVKFRVASKQKTPVELTQEFIGRTDNRDGYDKNESSPNYLGHYIQEDLSSYNELYWLLKLDDTASDVVLKFDLNDSVKSFMPYLWVSGDKGAKIAIEASKDGQTWLEIVSATDVEHGKLYGDTSALGTPTAWPNGINTTNMTAILTDNANKVVYLKYSYAGAGAATELQLQGFGITAKYDAAAESVEITTAPKTSYTLTDDLDVTGGKILVSYSDGSQITYDITADMVTGFSQGVAGTQTLTVALHGVSATYDIFVEQEAVSEIAIKTAPKTAYEVGDALDVTGGVLTVTFESGATAERDISASMISGFDTSAISDKVDVTVTYGGKTATYSITVSEKTESKEENIRIDAQPYSSGEDGMELENKEEQETAWDAAFGAESHPNRKDLNLNDLIKDSAFSMSSLDNGGGIWMNVFAGGYLTLEIDLPDRATDFDLTRGWGVYANCRILGSKDNGQTWYLVGRVKDEVSAMDTIFTSDELTEEQRQKNFEWMLVGNPEKKFLLKFVPDMEDDLEGKIQICNLGYRVSYNVGAGNTDQDLPTTVPADYEIPEAYNPGGGNIDDPGENGDPDNNNSGTPDPDNNNNTNNNDNKQDTPEDTGVESALPIAFMLLLTGGALIAVTIKKRREV